MISYHSLISLIILIHILHQWYEFISFVNDINSYFSSMIWIHICIFQSIPTTLTILPMASPIPENCMVASINNLLRLSFDLNSWTSKFLITHGDQSIDVSSAAQWALSSSPSGVYRHQNIPYPWTKYFFDDNIYFDNDAKFLLVKMIKLPTA